MKKTISQYFIVYLVLLNLAFLSCVANAYTPECPKLDHSKTSPAQFIGLASDPVSNAPIYCEYYYPEDNGGRLLVEYRDLEQSLIATKELNYKNNRLQPNVLQQDLRHGELRQVSSIANFPKVLDEGIRLQIQYQKANSEKIKQAELLISDSLVIDAGFDEAIRRYWSRLLAGESIKMDFLSPVHLKTFNLSIAVTEDKKYLISGKERNDTISFVIRPTNSLIKLFAAPILLSYDANEKRLLAYSGNVNITDIKGKTIQATIRYYYSS